MNTPLVTVCTPTYNRPEFLERTLRSCLAQTYTNFELIVTDNSTNDLSGKMIERLGDPRIRYYKNPKNLGPCGNSNRALTLVKGKYIKYLMDDDLIKPRCLELMVDAFEKHPSAGVVMAPMELIDADDKRIYPKFYGFRTMTYRYRYQVGDGLIPKEKILRDFLTVDYPCCVPSGMMFRAEIFKKFGEFDEAADFGGDLDKCMQIATEYDFFYIDEVLCSWRHMLTNHTGSLHQKGLKISVFYYLTRKLFKETRALELFPPQEREKLIRDAIYFSSCRAMLNGMAAIRAKSPKLMIETIKTIFREDPYFINKLRLPLFAFREVWVSLFPKKLPPARE
ncbi:MAG: glycosyl transferase family 2 [Verrucomicrobiales bacterium]|nr:glycosyl transferase family 2 [Verrucomicrobiales bacterium]